MPYQQGRIMGVVDAETATAEERGLLMAGVVKEGDLAPPDQADGNDNENAAMD